MSNFVLSISFIFILSLTFSVLLYLMGSVVSPKVKGTVGKLAPYACGEDLPAKKVQVNVRSFFLYITFFMVFDISAFILATSFGSQGFYPVLFSAIILLAVTTLLPIWRGKNNGFDQLG